VDDKAMNVENDEGVLAWHFLAEDRCLRYGDGRVVEAGQTLAAEGDLELCENGMHASIRPLDALGYAPGPILCRVRLGGEIIHGGDKAVARTRTVLWMVDATRALHEFACWCAERALTVAGVEDRRCWRAIESKRAWLRGEISDDELDAARAAAGDAARAAAWAAARAAAWAAAGDAAGDAAGAAARDAARAAARAAAGAAARDAARAAAWVAQNMELERIFMALGEGEA
jgi:hypothetical protein